jgi:hypothetical protein
MNQKIISISIVTFLSLLPIGNANAVSKSEQNEKYADSTSLSDLKIRLNELKSINKSSLSAVKRVGPGSYRRGDDCFRLQGSRLKRNPRAGACEFIQHLPDFPASTSPMGRGRTLSVRVRGSGAIDSPAPLTPSLSGRKPLWRTTSVHHGRGGSGAIRTC